MYQSSNITILHLIGGLILQDAKCLGNVVTYALYTMFG